MAPRTVIPLPLPHGSSSVHVDDNNTEEEEERRGGQERRKIFNLVLANGRSLPPKEVGSTRVLLVVAANPWRKIANRPAPWPHCSTPPDRLFLPHRLSPEPCLYQDPRRDEKSMLVSNPSFPPLFPDGPERDYNL